MQTTINPAEIAKFEAMATEWWDPNGKFKPLHMLNPCRLDYITSQIAAEYDRDLSGPTPFKGLRILDIGCGGGLLSEPMARLGAEVVGADAAEGNIPVAEIHAQKMGLTIDYRHMTAEAIAEAGEQFDVILNMEVVEHVADPQAFLNACHQLLKPAGLMVCSTLNRNPKSYMMAIIGAEHIMRWLPKGTHDWSKFITPDELYKLLESAGLDPVDRKGFVFNPFAWSWSISDRDLSVNYVTTSVRPHLIGPSSSRSFRICGGSQRLLSADYVEELVLRGAFVSALIVASVDLKSSLAPLASVWRVYEGFGRFLRGGIRLLRRLVHEGGGGRAA